MSWLAIYSQSGLEKSVAESLLLFSFPVFYPFVREVLRVTRGGSSNLETRERAYFPRYLFVDVPINFFSEIKKIKGVITVVNCLGEPLVIPDWVIETIRESGAPDGCMEEINFTKIPKVRFAGNIGDSVIIKWRDSILSGLQGKLSSLSRLDSHGEVGVFLRMLGSERECRVPVGVVRTIKPDMHAAVAVR